MKQTTKYSLGNPDKDRQRFVDAIVLISTHDWPNKLQNVKDFVEMPFEFGLRTSMMLGFARLK